VRQDVYADIVELIRETIAEQDTILLGRKMYEETTIRRSSSSACC
jgi:hypothetical protein